MIVKTLPLTKKKEKWVANRETSIRGTKLMYNAAQQERYTSALNRLIRQMTGETLRSINRLFKGTISEEFFKQQMEASAMDSSAMDASISAKARILTNALTKKFSSLFSKKAGSLAAMMLEGAKAASKSSLHASLKQLSGGLSLKTGVIPPGMEDIGRAIIAENVSLIKSIPDEYFKNVTGAVMRSITKGQGIADLIPDIQKYDGQTERRAKLLALDQTRKAYNSINKSRMQATGVKSFIWNHSGGSQFPRESHQKINDHVFSFENLDAEQSALGVPPNDRGLPAFCVNCRCTMIPVINFED